MTKQLCFRHLGTWFVVLLLALTPVVTHAEYEEEDSGEEYSEAQDEVQEAPPARPAKKKPRKKPAKRRYVTDHPERVDAGVFHVAIAAGGNFYTEPLVDNAKRPTGQYSKDFGFQAGAYFDYDYSQLDENIPLGLRGFLGYKYILSSVHVFTFDGMVRRMFQWSERASFGIGFGGSAAIWYRTIVSGISNEEQIIFLPSLALGMGFEFTPFMVDFKWLINQFGADSTRTGVELYFGFRL